MEFRAFLHHNCITTHQIDRKYVKTQSTVIELQSHGFGDASKPAYGAVVYGCFQHKDTTLTAALISAKVKISLIKDLSTSRLELNGAELLSRLLKAIAKDLDVPLPQIFTWRSSINSRPTATLDSLPDDGIPVLTPTHFLNRHPLLHALLTVLPDKVLLVLHLSTEIM